jgi:dihydrofolate reductase
MRPLRYSINVSLDGCVDHASPTFGQDADVHMHATRTIAEPDALIFGRTTYELMEFWRDPGDVPAWTLPFAEAITAQKKYLVSSTRTVDDWNAENLTGDPVEAVRALKAQPGGSLLVGGVQLPLALADAGLIDEYEFVVHPALAGHGPTLFAGLANPLRLELTGTTEFASGVVARRYRPVGSS